MTEQIRSYLEQVMRHSGLSKSERAEWMEEMAAHLHDEVIRLLARGHEEGEAITLALQKFGEPSLLRRKISRDTFGLSFAMIVSLSTLLFVLFLVDCGVLAFLIQSGAPSQYIPSISSMLKAIPMSPSLMLALGMSILTLLKTRCRKDRIALFVTVAVFGVLWVLMRMPLSFQANELLFGFKGLTIMEPWVSVITGVMVLWGLGLFLWTRNNWIGLFPVLLSIAVGVWAPIMWIILNRPQGDFTSLSISVAVRCIPIALLLLIFKDIDRHSIAGKSRSTTS